MKITIDNATKELYVHQFTNLGDMVKELQDLFPEGKWKEFNIVYPEPVHEYTYTVSPTTLGGSGYSAGLYSPNGPIQIADPRITLPSFKLPFPKEDE